MPYSPTYSQTSVSGTNTGNPVWVFGIVQPACLKIIAVGTPGATITVYAESNGGPLTQAGVPPANDWIDQSGGGYAVTIPAGGIYTLDKQIPVNGTACWRTRTVAGAGNLTLSSYVPFLVVATGEWVNAGLPPSASTPGFGY
jgi:hypothetical protein